MIGRGSISKVHLAVHKLTRKLVALKCVSKTYANQKKFEAIKNEIKYLALLRHENVIKLYEQLETDKYFLYYLELC
jgi:serine/threonine protein kinase